MQAFLLLALSVAAAIAAPSDPSRIVGGSEVSIDQYPYAVAMLFYSESSGNYIQSCGGSIINENSILSAANCYNREPSLKWRARVGSSYASSGGVVHDIADILIHRQFNAALRFMDNDISILRVSSPLSFNNNVSPGRFAGVDYFARENEDVWAVGWGRPGLGQPLSEELHHVQLKVANFPSCQHVYASIRKVSLNMICAGNIRGRAQCHGDAGGPLVHGDGVIVGVISGVSNCGSNPRLPGISMRVSKYESWIQNNA